MRVSKVSSCLPEAEREAVEKSGFAEEARNGDVLGRARPLSLLRFQRSELGAGRKSCSASARTRRRLWKSRAEPALAQARARPEYLGRRRQGCSLCLGGHRGTERALPIHSCGPSSGIVWRQ